MHSRVFQFSTKPIFEDDYLDDDTLAEETNMLNDRADYFDAEMDRESDIEWLVSSLNERGLEVSHTVEEVFDEALEEQVQVDKITFTHDSLISCIKKKLDDIKVTINDITDFEDNYFGSTMYNLKSMIIDDFGFYIWEDPTGKWCPLDSFLYDLTHKSKVNKEYVFYIGAVIDYHF